VGDRPGRGRRTGGWQRRAVISLSSRPAGACPAETGSGMPVSRPIPARSLRCPVAAPYRLTGSAS
jgi:hypothetical protein